MRISQSTNIEDMLPLGIDLCYLIDVLEELPGSMS